MNAWTALAVAAIWIGTSVALVAGVDHEIVLGTVVGTIFVVAVQKL